MIVIGSPEGVASGVFYLLRTLPDDKGRKGHYMLTFLKRTLFLPRDKIFTEKLLKIACPMALQQLLMSSLFIFDTIFISGLGDSYSAAAGQANHLTMLMWCGFGSVAAAGSIFAAQYWGKDQDIQGIRKAFTTGILINALIGLVFFILAFFFNGFVLSVLTPFEEVRAIGREYLTIVGFAYPIWAVTSVFAALLRSVNITYVPLVSSVVGSTVNILLDSVLVTGNLGFPRLGVKAAAASTIIGAFLELVMLLILTRKFNTPLKMSLKDFINPGIAMVKEIFIKSIPIVVKNQMWALGVIVYSIAFATLGIAHTAAFTVYNTLGEFMNILFVAIGNAGGIILGQELGAAEMQNAKDYAWRLLRVTFLTGVILCPVFILLNNVMVLPFPELTPEAIGYTKQALILMSFFIWAKGINYTNMNGILPSGGDTFGAAVIDIGMLWIVGVPLTAVAAIVLHQPFWVVFLMTCTEEFIKVGVGIFRVRKYKWARRLV
jgi:putative MATE family efflux protein